MLTSIDKISAGNYTFLSKCLSHFYDGFSPGSYLYLAFSFHHKAWAFAKIFCFQLPTYLWSMRRNILHYHPDSQPFQRSLWRFLAHTHLFLSICLSTVDK